MVREAMKLGAEDYLLKVTLQSDDLLELMRTVSERIEKERERERENVQLRVALKRRKRERAMSCGRSGLRTRTRLGMKRLG
ncbi:response regulator [Paenibacillus apiarius]|uniref:Response regulatory domain-containing protein n=1 Tax=Paenibacillus apiarius TaxID=46240 RepID=A0ABT4E1I9_9BACL|nr:hypothetical protein [Paenibacillus apiarius]MCY9512875.1 hypothetical protein [Paenibacillus apiarius]MCY9522076.1 hypothetical protein [Paenibacillus apiarius]MCY9554105.1 hypothetical protein [Paenibacillus apiarius]MCY9558836.1 hypothetical protein [Paenibacillus apiarius]MCY9683883.1 hypothetical protein [Paenibacillus apiarius]